MAVGVSALRLGYVGLFVLAAGGCVVGVIRARRIDHPDTRRGLVGLLAISGGWALIQGVRLLASARGLKVALDILGLIVGLASVGAWLYFCSAYTGQSYHRNTTIRRFAVGVFLTISTVKLTNPIHGQYLTVQSVAEPFPHVVILPTPLHWSVAGIAYVLSAIGFYMLFELFYETRYQTGRLGVLVSLAGLPAIATIGGYAGLGPFVQMDYEPIGVAVFAIGTLYFAEDMFQAVHHHGRSQVFDELDEAVLLLDDEGRLQDFNDAAREVFPAVSRPAQGTQLNALVPELAAAVDSSEGVIERSINDETQYFVISDETLSLGPHEVGRAIISTEVTELERHRRELARREEQLDEVVEALTHELRNAVTIVQSHLTLADEALDNDKPTTKDRLETAQATTDRMTRVINDLVTLAQHGGLVSQTDTYELDAIITDARKAIDTSQLSIAVDQEGTIEGNRTRLIKLFAHAFQFASANDASQVRISRTENGLVIEDDGDPIQADRTKDLFTYGEAIPDGERGGILPTVRTLARVHGWTVSVDPTYEDGLRYQISDITTSGIKLRTS